MHPGFQEQSHDRSDLIDSFVEGKVPGIEDMNLGLRHLLFINICTRERERRVVLAPNDQERWLVLPGKQVAIGDSSSVRSTWVG
jgi:hypothetical protein